jgi:hypothetical protein
MTKYALLIGITYFNTEHKIYGSVNDVIMMKNFLVNKKGYADENIIVLRDDDNQYLQPNKDNINKYLAELIQRSNEDATELFLYFSGYSNLDGDGNENCIYCSDLTYIDNTYIRFILSGLNTSVNLFGIFDCINLNNNFDFPYSLTYKNDNFYVLHDNLKIDREFINNKILIYGQNRLERKVYDNFNNNKFGGFLTANMIEFLSSGKTFYGCLAEFYRLFNGIESLPVIYGTQDISKLFMMNQLQDMNQLQNIKATQKETVEYILEQVGEELILKQKNVGKKEEPIPVLKQKEEPKPVLKQKEEPKPVLKQKEESKPVLKQKEESKLVLKQKEVQSALVLKQKETQPLQVVKQKETQFTPVLKQITQSSSNNKIAIKVAPPKIVVSTIRRALIKK